MSQPGYWKFDNWANTVLSTTVFWQCTGWRLLNAITFILSIEMCKLYCATRWPNVYIKCYTQSSDSNRITWSSAYKKLLMVVPAFNWMPLTTIIFHFLTKSSRWRLHSDGDRLHHCRTPWFVGSCDLVGGTLSETQGRSRGSKATLH